MVRINQITRIYKYLKDPRPDLRPALKLIKSPEFKMPVWDFIKYFANLGANKIPGIKQIVGRERVVDFSEYMLAYDKTTATFVPYREMLSRIVELLEIKGGELVIDLGAGTGNLSIAVEQKGAKVISVDCSPEANEIHKSKNPQASILEVNIDRSDDKLGFIPMPDHSIDRVCAANLWTYIRNRSTLYTEIKRLLKPDGLFVLAVEREGYSPLQILKDHLSKEYHRYLREGDLPLTALVRVYTDFISKYEDLLTTAEETKKLMRGIAAGDYVVFTEKGIIEELEGNRFKVLLSEIAYAAQAIIVKARKQIPS